MKLNRILVVTGGKFHDFEGAAAELKQIFDVHPRYAADFATGPSAFAGDLSGYRAIVAYTQGGEMTPDEEKGLTGFVKGGGGFLGIHGATASWQNNADYMMMIGAQFAGHGRVHDIPVVISNREHPAAARVLDFTLPDELYLLKQHAPIDVYATTWRLGKHEPMAFSRQYGEGRVAYVAGGHQRRWFRHPSARRLILRGLDYVTGFEGERELTAAIIGYGGAFNMGRKHGQQLSQPGNAMRVVAVCDRDATRLDEAQTDFPGIGVFTDVGEMLAQAKPDLAIIITPHDSHEPLAVQCLEAGAHVVVEKPMAIGAAAANHMIEASQKAGRSLTVYHNRRLDADYLALKHIVETGLIGRVFRIENHMANFNRPGSWWRSFKDVSGGVHYDWGAHNVDWILGLLPGDPVVGVAGYAQKRLWEHVTNQDEMKWTLRFKSGAVADLVQSSISTARNPRWTVVGTGGSATFVSGATHPESYFHVIQPSAEFVRAVETQIPFVKDAGDSFYLNLADHLHRGDAPLVPAEEARRVIAILDAAEKSADAGREQPVEYEEV